MAVPFFSCVEDQSIFDALCHVGAFVLDVPELAALNDEVLRWFVRFEAQPTERKAEFALAADGTGENNGWHGPGGLSAYNRFRTGYIFQSTEPIWPMIAGGGSEGREFAAAHERWRSAVHDLGYRIIASVARAMGISGEQFGPGGQCDIAAGAQFHQKAICRGVAGAPVAEEQLPSAATADGRVVALPAHRDPSVISIIIATGPGLQFLVEGEGRYEDVPRFGPGVCTVIAGQILTKLTRGLVRSPLHRVVSDESAMARAERIAATFFFQPPLDAVLRPLDAPAVLEYVRCAEASPEQHSRSHTKVRTGGERGSTKTFAPITYRQWKHSAYKNYYKREQ